MNASRCTLLLTTFACLWGYQAHAMEEKNKGVGKQASQLVVAAAAKTVLGVPDKAIAKKAGGKKRKPTRKVRKRKKRRTSKIPNTPKKTYAQAAATKVKELKDSDTKSLVTVTKGKEEVKVATPKDKVSKDEITDTSDASLESEETVEATDEYTALGEWEKTEDTKHIASMPVYATGTFYNKDQYEIKILEQDPDAEEGILRLRKGIEQKKFFDEDGNEVKLFDKDGAPKKLLYKVQKYKRPKLQSEQSAPVYLKWSQQTKLHQNGWMNKNDLDELHKKNGGRVTSKLNTKTNDIDYYIRVWEATEVEEEEPCHFNPPYSTLTKQYCKVTKKRGELKLAENITRARKNALAANKARIQAEEQFKAAEQKFEDLVLGADSQKNKACMLLKLFEKRICPAITKQHESKRSDLIARGTKQADEIKQNTSKSANILLAERERLEKEQTRNEESLANIEAVLPKEEQQKGWW